MMMNTANKLTLLRIAMIPVFLLVLYFKVPYANYWALGIFVAASLTDTLDGYIARHYNQITDFGKFMDPLADKMLVVAALLWFVEIGQMPGWALLVVIVREFAVSGLRMIAADKGRVIAAGWSGKVKTASTMVCIVLMFLPIEPLFNQICLAVIVLTGVSADLFDALGVPAQTTMDVITESGSVITDVRANPDALSGPLRTLCQLLLDLLPTGQVIRFRRPLPAGELLRLAGCAAAFSGVLTALGLLFFQRKDVR